MGGIGPLVQGLHGLHQSVLPIRVDGPRHPVGKRRRPKHTVLGFQDGAQGFLSDERAPARMQEHAVLDHDGSGLAAGGDAQGGRALGQAEHLDQIRRRKGREAARQAVDAIERFAHEPQDLRRLAGLRHEAQATQPGDPLLQGIDVVPGLHDVDGLGELDGRPAHQVDAARAGQIDVGDHDVHVHVAQDLARHIGVDREKDVELLVAVVEHSMESQGFLLISIDNQDLGTSSGHQAIALSVPAAES